MELATSLKGPALTVMVDLDPTLRSDYLELVNALDIRFKATSSSELFRVQMKTRVKKRAESLAEMAQDIKRLTRQAYPLYPATMREPLALDCFVDALPDQEMRWTIYQNKPKTLDEALQLATEYEGFRMAAEKRHQTKSSMSSSRVNQDNYVFAMDGISEETQGNIYRYKSRNCANCKERGHNSRDCPKPRKCYNCGEEGHYKRNCPKQTQRNHHQLGKLEATGTAGRVPVNCEDRPLDNEETSMFITAWIGSKPIECLIDSGASISVINHTEYEKRRSALLKPISKCRSSISMANGAMMDAPGIAHMPVNIGDEHFEVPFVIADIATPAILGMDFIRKHKGIINSTNNELVLDGVRHHCHCSEIQSHVFRVTLAEDIEIAANSEMIIPGKMGGMKSGAAIIECNGRLPEEYGILVARGIVNTSKEIIPIRTANLYNEPQTMHKGTVVALGQPVEEDMTIHPLVASVNSNGKDEEGLDSIPEYMEDLWTRSQINLNNDEKFKAQNMLIRKRMKFAKNKGDLGRTKVVRHTIDIEKNRPIKIRPGRMPKSKREEGEKEIKRMLDQGIIVPSKSPWAAPVVLVRKKDRSIRVCTDFRLLNKVTIKDSYPLPRIDDSLDALSGSVWFSTLDLMSGYWQVEVDPKDREKTAFATTGGLYEYNVMPFGLANAPATFERLMEQVLRGLHWQTCLVYLDDIIVFSKTFDTHLARLEEVIDRNWAAGLQLSPKKCHLFQSEVVFLGHVVNKDGISTDPAKIQTVKDWPEPKSVKEVRSFLGLCYYYRKFVQGFATIAKPLHGLTQKDKAFFWSETCQRAFESLKTAVISSPILAYSDAEGELILDTDASGVGLGAVLSQVQEGSERVIGYYSRTLTQPERQYCVTRRELLALVAAVKQFHTYLYGRKVTVRTDHGALRWLLNFKNLGVKWLVGLGT